jgi:hypothetical protein
LFSPQRGAEKIAQGESPGIRDRKYSQAPTGLHKAKRRLVCRPFRARRYLLTLPQGFRPGLFSHRPIGAEDGQSPGL